MGFVQVFSEKTTLIPKRTTHVVYPVYFVLLNFHAVYGARAGPEWADFVGTFVIKDERIRKVIGVLKVMASVHNIASPEWKETQAEESKRTSP